MYSIERIVNNNIVISKDESGRELILRGLGIGFGRKKNDTIEDEKVEKIYRMSNRSTAGKLETLLAEIPEDQLETSTQIIEYAKDVLTKRINDNIILTLTDHINFALQRHDMGMDFTNPLLWDIRKFYPAEYAVAVHGLKLIDERHHVKLKEDEAGFIALHFVNAELDTDMGNTVQITEMIQQIVQIVKEYYTHPIDETSVPYERFITHLKYLGQRLLDDKNEKENMDDVDLFDIICAKYPEAYACTKRIETFLLENYEKEIQKNEKMYLTIHLRRITINTD